jgi:hypothetical protein
MRTITAVLIVLGIIGLGFTVYFSTAKTEAGDSTTLSIQYLHRDHPGMASMPVDQAPLP